MKNDVGMHDHVPSTVLFSNSRWTRKKKQSHRWGREWRRNRTLPRAVSWICRDPSRVHSWGTPGNSSQKESIAQNLHECAWVFASACVFTLAHVCDNSNDELSFQGSLLLEHPFKATNALMKPTHSLRPCNLLAHGMLLRRWVSRGVERTKLTEATLFFDSDNHLHLLHPLVWTHRRVFVLHAGTKPKPAGLLVSNMPRKRSRFDKEQWFKLNKALKIHAYPFL